MLEVTDSNFEEKVLNSKKPAIVDFWAEWCGPCRILGPVFEKLSKEMGEKIVFAKLNVDQNQKVTGKYDIRGIPAMLVFKNGSEVDRLTGALSEGVLRQKLSSIILHI